jgi:hypothetical protein
MFLFRKQFLSEHSENSCSRELGLKYVRSKNVGRDILPPAGLARQIFNTPTNEWNSVRTIRNNCNSREPNLCMYNGNGRRNVSDLETYYSWTVMCTRNAFGHTQIDHTSECKDLLRSLKSVCVCRAPISGSIALPTNISKKNNRTMKQF